jgi:hypothetical protein
MSITKQLRGWCVPFATFISTFAVFGTQNAFSAAVTYTFSQSGWTDGAGDVGTLTGSFTGTPEANGTIQLADLTSFLASFHETVGNVPNTFNFTAPAAFSFDTNSPSSLEFSAGSAASNIQICSGSTDTQQICLGISPTSGAASPDVGYFLRSAELWSKPDADSRNCVASIPARHGTRACVSGTGGRASSSANSQADSTAPKTTTSGSLSGVCLDAVHPEV